MTSREAIVEFIRHLPDDAVAEVEVLLEQYRTARFERLLAEAPEDSEELTPDEVARIERGLAEAERGQSVPHDVVMRLVDEWKRAAS